MHKRAGHTGRFFIFPTETEDSYSAHEASGHFWQEIGWPPPFNCPICFFLPTCSTMSGNQQNDVGLGTKGSNPPRV